MLIVYFTFAKMGKCGSSRRDIYNDFKVQIIATIFISDNVILVRPAESEISRIGIFTKEATIIRSKSTWQ
jgi:hypothetical protein